MGKTMNKQTSMRGLAALLMGGTALAGLSAPQRATVAVMADRRRAIEHAIAAAAAEDCVLIAGKGHETWQEIHGVRWPFDDAAVARAALAARGEAP